MTKFLAGHELKAGVDWEHQDSSIDRYAAAPACINYKLGRRGGVIYYRHRFYVNDRAPGFDADDPVHLAAADPAR